MIVNKLNVSAKCVKYERHQWSSLAVKIFDLTVHEMSFQTQVVQ